MNADHGNVPCTGVGKRGEVVMNHGGITIDEVIVPFIKIKAVDNNG